jgi:spore maturation protein A
MVLAAPTEGKVGMLNIVWLALLVGSVVVGAWNGCLREVALSVTSGAVDAFKLALGFAGIMALWLGIMKIAEESGLVGVVTRLIAPIMRRLFPRIPEGHPALGSITMNIVANMFGLNNAATPLGIRAMKDLEKLNSRAGEASDEMCMFLAVNTSSVQIIPAGAIALLASGGARDPAVIVLPAILATAVSTAVAIISARALSRMKRFRRNEPKGSDDEGTS